MNVVRHTDSDYAEKIGKLAAQSSLFDPVIEQRARDIIDAVRSRGDAAVLELTARFDGAQLSAEQLGITAAELMAASLKADVNLREAIEFAHKNITAFARRSMRKGWSVRNDQGAKVGEKFNAFSRVGIYIPGGTAPLVSTALMTIVLAQVAGCREIVVCTPAGVSGEINPALLFAINRAGATEIYRVGGAQAIAAMALGTGTVPRVQKVFGPGNAYVVAAKRLLFGHVSIDLLPGPSEVLVLADDSANPRFIAADLLAQAEHGSGHERVWLVTPSAKLIKAVDKEIAVQMPTLSRREFIDRALTNNGWLIQTKSLEESIQLTNRLAPEHCEVMTRNPGKISQRIHTAGAIFLGSWSPTVLGDYVAGPSHTLPTGGCGTSFAGLTVDQFQRRTSMVEYTRSSLEKSVTQVQKFAELEGLDAHGRSAAIRANVRRASKR
ncbi:MAG: histidinol dehydrogenase [Pedosphaera sp.]|nr:histidinol dehydrogenase [Pedosphaera sp.]